MKMPLVLSAACVDSLEAFEMFERSCRKYNIEHTQYGVGECCPGMSKMMVNMTIPFLQSNIKRYDHVLYTDSRDAFFCAPLEEVMEKYEGMGSPSILTASTVESWPLPQLEHFYPSTGTDYKFPHSGGYLGTIEAVLEMAQEMSKYTDTVEDESAIWQLFWAMKEWRPLIDSKCEVFQVNRIGDLKVKDKRLFNKHTKSNPCIMHFSGGYSDPVQGKWPTMIDLWGQVHPDLDQTEPKWTS
jgi:hypothetical protein